MPPRVASASVLATEYDFAIGNQDDSDAVEKHYFLNSITETKA